MDQQILSKSQPVVLINWVYIKRKKCNDKIVYIKKETSKTTGITFFFLISNCFISTHRLKSSIF